VLAIPDDEILEAMVDLARRAGLFCEPTGAASITAARAEWATWRTMQLSSASPPVMASRISPPGKR
jgi:threonine dehydratase